jgi:hypothetical protein
MKKLIALLCIVTVVACNTEKKESLDYVKLLKVKEAIEKGSGNAVKRYEDMLGANHLENIEANPEFIDLKNQALTDVNNLIVEALENGVDKQALLDCIKANGADSPQCEEFVKPVRSNAMPRLQQFDAELGKFIANHLDKNSHLPKVEGNCNAIHMGVFQLLIEGDTMLISRDKDTQIEQFRGDVRREKVTWINDCTYHLELIKEEVDSTQLLVGPGGFLNDSFIEIIRVTDEYYMYKIFDSASGEEGELVDIGKVYFNK